MNITNLKSYLRINHSDDDSFLSLTCSGIESEARVITCIYEVDTYTDYAYAIDGRISLIYTPVTSIISVSGMISSTEYEAVTDVDDTIIQNSGQVIYNANFVNGTRYKVVYEGGSGTLPLYVNLAIYEAVATLYRTPSLHDSISIGDISFGKQLIYEALGRYRKVTF